MTIKLENLNFEIAELFIKKLNVTSLLEIEVLEILCNMFECNIFERKIVNKKNILNDLYIYEIDNLNSDAINIIKYLINKDN